MPQLLHPDPQIFAQDVSEHLKDLGPEDAWFLQDDRAVRIDELRRAPHGNAILLGYGKDAQPFLPMLTWLTVGDPFQLPSPRDHFAVWAARVCRDCQYSQGRRCEHDRNGHARNCRNWTPISHRK